MKNSFLVFGGLLVLINTSAGLVFSSYKPFNMILADVSIILSTILIYGAFKSTIADGFKIGLSFFFLLSGVARFLCAVFSSEQMENNIAFIVFMCFIAIEAISYFVAKYLSSK